MRRPFGLKAGAHPATNRDTMATVSTHPLMWRGTCHSVPADDVRALLRAGLVRRAPGAVERYEGVPAKIAEHRAPADAVRWVRQRTGGSGASAGAERPTGFWQAPSRPQKAASRRPARRRRSIFSY